MKGDQTTLDLFDSKEEVESYETMSLNTTNLIQDDDLKDIGFSEGEKEVEQNEIDSAIKETSETSVPHDEIRFNEVEKPLENNEENKEESSLEPIDERKIINEMAAIRNYGQVNIMAIGIGGCGVNTIDRMQGEHFKNITLVAIDTSKQSLDNITADKKILIGESVFAGHGSGNDIEKVVDVFLETEEEIRDLLQNVNMVFLTGGIGRGTGSAGLIAVGKIAREMGILTIGFATLPRAIEADVSLVERYYQLFVETVDSNIVVENDIVNKIARDLPIGQAMKIADKMLIDGIKGISDLIINPGKINLDYADIRTAFSNKGSCVMGIGYASGDHAVADAIEDSIDSEMIDFQTIRQAQTIIFNITCAPNTVTIREASEGTELIYSKNEQSSNLEHMLFGYSYDQSLEGEVKVTFIATGTEPKNFEDYKNDIGRKNSLFNNTNKNISVDLFSSVGEKETDKPDFFR